MEAIKQWLESGCDYKTGVALMQEHHPNKGLCRNLARVESETHQQILRYELEKLAAAPPVVIIPAAAPVKVEIPTGAEDSKASEGFKDLTIEEVIVKQGKVYNKRSMLSNHLVDHAEEMSQEDRKKMVDQIEELRLVYNKLAEIKRQLQEGKKVQIPEEVIAEKPETANLNSLNKEQLLLERANLRSNQSKVKKSITKYQHQPAKVHSYKEKEARIKARLDQIEILLKK